MVSVELVLFYPNVNKKHPDNFPPTYSTTRQRQTCDLFLLVFLKNRKQQIVLKLSNPKHRHISFAACSAQMARLNESSVPTESIESRESHIYTYTLITYS